MQVLLVESCPDLARLWRLELERAGWKVHQAATASAAVRMMDHLQLRMIVLDLELVGGSALSVPIYAGYRLPDARVVIVTGSTVFNDGSIFDLCANACAYLSTATPPGDLAALVDFHGQRARPGFRSPRSPGHEVH